MKNKKTFLLLLLVPIIIFFIGRSFSLTYNKEVKSVEIQSYDYPNPGSWHIDKSAEWTEFGKARVTFDVNSVLKTEEGRYKDVILVIDISGSMEGDKLAKAKSDAIELTNYLLSDTHNSIALITFDTTSEIITDFIKDKEIMLGYLNDLIAQDNTNYNSALKNVDIIMQNYVRKENTDLVTLFLTDGYPNEETPNEVATYHLLKDEYPYMTINGIQYEMGIDIIQELINISDNQWVADRDTLHNVLFDAIVSSLTFDNFVITDYVNGEFFYLFSEDDINVPFGNVLLEEENGIQKITWNLENNYKTGENIKMTIDLTLKEVFQKSKGFYPTNKKELIESDIDELTSRKETNLTPVLKNGYDVIYDINTPNGCDLSAIDNETYIVNYKVTKKNDKLVCPGYLFKGWEVVTNEDEIIKYINDDMFFMPDHDVVIRATWAKESLVKKMDGKVKEVVTGMLKKQTCEYGSVFGKNIARPTFEKIMFLDSINVPDNAIDSWDASEEQNESIIAWYTDSNNNSKYELYIAQNGGVRANIDSSCMLYGYMNVGNINMEKLDTSLSTNMNSMFKEFGRYYTGELNMDITNFDTSKVTSMNSMFMYVGNNASNTTINMSDLNTRNVIDMNSMLYYVGYNSNKVTVHASNLDTSSVNDMSYVFNYLGYNANELNFDAANWTIKSSINTSYMFTSVSPKATKINIDLTGWNLSQNTSTAYMFEYFAQYSKNGIINLIMDDWNTSGVENMRFMFNGAMYFAKNIKLDFSDWDVSNVKRFDSMFQNCGNTASGYMELDFTGWNTSNATSMNRMFYMTGSYIGEMGYIGSRVEYKGLSGWNTSSVTSMEYMFESTGKYAQTFILGDLSNWTFGSNTNTTSMFDQVGYKATNVNDIGTLDIYSNNLYYFLCISSGVKATINLHNAITSYSSAFASASTIDGSGIIVNYTNAVTNIDDIIATKSNNNSNVVKGSIIE